MEQTADAHGAGSSPLTRGKRFPALVVGVRWGLIPAHAGKTHCGHYREAAWAAHPRSRGENQNGSLGRPQLTGSSPLTRGKQLICDRTNTRHGLIPAHAGKTDIPLSREEMKRAHPRSRGENLSRLNCC